ncbi:AbrB family transcriptional regulator [Dysosmobacter sp.]|uniref:AbrB family transcriptional regulator n=1 Tax=Dysosmobacter sp. TaxID=2591382 RepID=UPI002A94FB68|nr:AbrB family transcriptional regulator [Dysosmobacter sp.]MDY5611855.1 AbrB family transcriptional regulator [Dysosmobacter sp.]
MIQTTLTLALSAAVGYLLYRKHVPAGMLIGAVIASAVLTAAFHAGHIPDAAKNIAQVIAGTFIGCSARREDFHQLRTFWKPVLMITFSLLVVNMAIGFLLCLTGYSDLLTCLVCAIPGGIAETTLIASDFGADPSKVLLVHFCRLIVGLMVFPLVVERFTPPMRETASDKQDGCGEVPDPRRNTLRLLAALAVAALCAWGGSLLHIPAAPVLCSLLSTFLLNISGFPIRFPQWLRRVAQILSGAYIGCLLDPSRFGSPVTVLWAILITTVVLLANAAVFGRWMEKLFGVPLREGMLMLTPAGASDMALISADIGVSSPRLILVQIYRLIIATAIFPQICLLINGLFS